jgi:hypothetical protein
LKASYLVFFKATWAALTGCRALRYRLDPRDMPFKTKRFRYLAVAIPIVAIASVIATSPRQQSPQPEQPDLTYHQTVFGWRSR